MPLVRLAKPRRENNSVQNPYIKVAWSIALCCFVVGGFTTYTGLDTLHRANHLDDDWEKVTLRDFRVGNHENETLFELTEARVADSFWALEDRHGNEFSSVYVPIYAVGQKEDAGAGIQVVAMLFDCEDMGEVDARLDAAPLRVQASTSNRIPPAMRQLSNVYPNIHWDNVRVVRISEKIPTAQGAISTLMFGGALLLIGLASIAFTCRLWFRRFQATRGDYADQLEKLEMDGQQGKKDIHRSVLASTLHQVSATCSKAVPILIVFNAILAVATRADLLSTEIAMCILPFTLLLFFGAACFPMAVSFFVGPSFAIERKNQNDVPTAALKKIDAEVKEFQRLGFQMLGYAQTSCFGDKWNAFLISRNFNRVVEISLGNNRASCTMIGVTNNGLIYCTGNNEVDMDVDGTVYSVPLAANCRINQTPVETLQIFNAFESSLHATGAKLLLIRPEDVFHLMHYDSITAGWWAYRSSLRSSKPECLPSLSELCVSIDGRECFNFRRIESLDNAFQIDFARNDDRAPSDNQLENIETTGVPAQTATFGGEELTSARFMEGYPLG